MVDLGIDKTNGNEEDPLVAKALRMAGLTSAIDRNGYYDVVESIVAEGQEITVYGWVEGSAIPRCIRSPEEGVPTVLRNVSLSEENLRIDRSVPAYVSVSFALVLLFFGCRAAYFLFAG